MLLFALAVTSLFWITLQNQIDHHVHIAINEAHQIVQNYQGAERDALIKNLVSAQGMTVVVLSPDGSAILETNSPDVALTTEHQLQKILISKTLYQSRPVHFTENNIHFAAMTVQVSGGKGIVAVGYSTQILYATFYRMLGIIVTVVLFLVFPMALIGHKLLKKQLYPLESIADQAKAVVDTTSLSRRIRLPTPTAELETIQKALNSMLSQLEKIFKNERAFFSDSAHTLKTPLAILRSQIENSQLTKVAQKNLLSTIDSMNDTIQDLLFLSKVGSRPQKPSLFSLSKLLEDLSELITTLGEDKQLRVTTDLQPNVTITADRKMLQRALSNIVHNAVIYNKSKGAIHLSLRLRNHQIVISIKDTGIGIATADLPLVFTRFFRGKNMMSKGSGLGLAIAKAVIENMGGTISLTSAKHQGTTVIVVFPAVR